jgi:hypothetical protein
MSSCFIRFFKQEALCCLVALGLLGAARTTVASDVEQWGVWETSLKGASAGNPYLDVQFSATFRQDGKEMAVPGFYDGNGNYKLRFSPPKQGQWTYETKSNLTELSGKSGSLNAVKPTGNNHGPVEVYKTFTFRYADGTRYHMLGTTSYQWTSMPEELQQTTLKSLAASSFNKYRYCIFPKWYAHNQVEPDRAAFQKKEGGGYDFNKPDPAFWARFEQRLVDLQKLGIEAELILWHPYDKRDKTWGFKNMGKAEDDRYLRYCIARLSAYRNVMWSLANEWDFTGKPVEDYDRFGTILQNEDPYQHLRSVHNGSGTKVFDPSKSWITHVSLQGYNTNTGVALREKYNKPVVFDEYGYEGDIPEGYGRNKPMLIVQRQYWATFSGIYGTHGECYQDENEVIWWGKGGLLKGESWKRTKFLKEILEQAPAFDELKPIGELVLAKDGEYYAMYCRSPGKKTIELAGNRSYKVEVLDPWEMTVTAAGTANQGSYTFTPAKADLIYRFTSQ